jgi:hypothetical protein
MTNSRSISVELNLCLCGPDKLFELPFEGDREYIRACGIHQCLSALALTRFGPGAFIDSLTLRKVSRSQLRFSLQPISAANGSFRIRVPGKSVAGWFVEAGSPISTRVSFDSAPLHHRMVKGPGFAQLPEPIHGYTPLQVMDGLAKALALEVDPARKWWFNQLELNTPLDPALDCEVRVRRVIERQFVLCELRQLGCLAGSLRVTAASASAPNR